LRCRRGEAMRFHFQAGPDVSELDLVSALWTVGGGSTDGVHIPGLPAALVQLAVGPVATWLHGRRSIRVGRAPVDANSWRLLLPGEWVELQPAGRLRLPPVPPVATAGLLRALAAGDWPLPRSAAAALVSGAGPHAGAAFPLGGGGGGGGGDGAGIPPPHAALSPRAPRPPPRGRGARPGTLPR